MVSDIPVSCGISHPGACTQMGDCLLLRVSLSSALPGPSSCSQGCRAIQRLLFPTASEHRPLGISLPFSVGVAAHSPLGTVTKGNTSHNVFLLVLELVWGLRSERVPGDHSGSISRTKLRTISCDLEVHPNLQAATTILRLDLSYVG